MADPMIEAWDLTLGMLGCGLLVGVGWRWSRRRRARAAAARRLRLKRRLATPRL